MPGRVVRAVLRAPRISMDSGTENMDWVARALRRIIDVHPGRRRDQRRRRRDQRRRPAVLERRGHDAHAHQGHPGHDAGQRDGADRQALAGLLRRGVGRGQLRHRRLRPGHGAERPGAVLGAEPDGRRASCCSRTTTTPTSRPGERWAAAGRRPSDPRRPGRARRSRTATRRATSRPSATSSPPTANPERKKPFDIRTVMRAVTDQDHAVLERWAGMADADTVRRLRRAPGRAPGDGARASSRGRSRGAAASPPTARTSGRRARCSRARRRRRRGRSTRPAATGRWWCWPTCRASTAHRSRCATCSSSTAPRSAGRSSTSTARSSSASSPATTAARSWCSPASLNDNMEVLAVEGSFASVLGGAPAAAVVFTREVDKRTAADPRVRELEAALAVGRRRRAGPPAGGAGDAAAAVRSEKLGEVAAEFEAVHDIERARRGRLGARHHPGRRAAAPAHRRGRARAWPVPGRAEPAPMVPG